MSTTQLDPKWKPSLSDKVSTMPAGWDLSSIPERPNSTGNAQPDPDHSNEPEMPSEFEAKERTDWQLDPHFDRRPNPNRRDLSAY
jgi:hypothetical protein